MLLEAVKADPPMIKLGGFVTLNRPLVVSVSKRFLRFICLLVVFEMVIVLAVFAAVKRHRSRSRKRVGDE